MSLPELNRFGSLVKHFGSLIKHLNNKSEVSKTVLYLKKKIIDCLSWLFMIFFFCVGQTNLHWEIRGIKESNLLDMSDFPHRFLDI